MNSAVIDPIEQLMDRLVVALEQRKPKRLDETLWSTKEIAVWLKLSQVTVDLRVVSRADFPAAFRPVDTKQAQRRWFASDVLAWARENKGTVPTPRPGRRRKSG